MSLHATMHYVAMWRQRGRFKDYRHHRETNPFFYGAYWLRSWARKLGRMSNDRHAQQQLFDRGTAYYFVPLQHDGDAQLTHHSRFQGNTNFVIEVMRSFAEHAPPESRLVFRQHPHARGGPGHAKLIEALTQELGLGPRVLHLVEGDTPALAEQSCGVVVINSTVGLQALERGAPLIVMGEALYKHAHLTYDGSLDSFWTQARPPERHATDALLLQIKNLTQAPASVYANRAACLLWKRAGHDGRG